MDQATIISINERRIRVDISGPWGSVPGSLRLPFGSGINPHADELQSQNIEWTKELELVDRDGTFVSAIERCQFDQLAALCHRKCSLEALQLITNCYTAIFAFDDMLDDARSVIGSSPALARHVTAYLSASVADEPRPELDSKVPGRERIVAVGNAYADVARRLLAYTNREGLRHYVAGMRDYFRGCVLEADLRHKQVKSVAEYSAVRLGCSAVYPTLDIGAIVDGVVVSDEHRAQESFQAMRVATNLCVSYVNDIYSYAKESSAGETSNLVTVYEQSYGVPLRSAMQAAMRTNDRVVGQYLAAKARFTRQFGVDAHTQGYMEIMEDWMRGNFDWYNEMRTRRYTEYLTTAIPA